MRYFYLPNLMLIDLFSLIHLQDRDFSFSSLPLPSIFSSLFVIKCNIIYHHASKTEVALVKLATKDFPLFKNVSTT